MFGLHGFGRPIRSEQELLHKHAELIKHDKTLSNISDLSVEPPDLSFAESKDDEQFTATTLKVEDEPATRKVALSVLYEERERLQSSSQQYGM